MSLAMLSHCDLVGGRWDRMKTNANLTRRTRDMKGRPRGSNGPPSDSAVGGQAEGPHDAGSTPVIKGAARARQALYCAKG